jgi:hypothetical protein
MPSQDTRALHSDARERYARVPKMGEAILKTLRIGAALIFGLSVLVPIGSANALPTTKVLPVMDLVQVHLCHSYCTRSGAGPCHSHGSGPLCGWNNCSTCRAPAKMNSSRRKKPS